ncbi:MAG: DUF368 domain-containing protein [Spirochaetaceae bacterium]|nr:MAG: DUF368 domain-containing protein [Spirochaetaceae bacterium]
MPVYYENRSLCAIQCHRGENAAIMKQFYTRLRRGAAYVTKGTVIGIANIIPGVSGGTVAVALGIYDRLIRAINGLLGRSRGALAELPFLALVAVGVLAGIFVFAGAFEHLYAFYPAEVAFLFLGLILGGLGPLWHTASRYRLRPRHAVACLAGLVLVLSLLLVTPAEFGGQLPQLSATVAMTLILSGVVAAAAMVIPGVSGSLVLLLIGTYGPILHAVSDRNLAALALVMLGVVIGGIAVTRIVAILLQRAPATAYSAVIGLVLGSVPRLFPGFPEGTALVASVAAFALGFAIAIIIEPRDRRRTTAPARGEYG